MTEDDKRQQKAMLLLECQEAEQELAHLCERAKRMSSELCEVADYLQRAAKRPTEHPGLNIPGSPERYRQALDFDRAVAAATEIRAAEKRVQELRSRKEALGLR